MIYRLGVFPTIAAYRAATTRHHRFRRNIKVRCACARVFSLSNLKLEKKCIHKCGVLPKPFIIDVRDYSNDVYFVAESRKEERLVKESSVKRKRKKGRKKLISHALSISLMEIERASFYFKVKRRNRGARGGRGRGGSTGDRAYFRTPVVLRVKRGYNVSCVYIDPLSRTRSRVRCFSSFFFLSRVPLRSFSSFFFFFFPRNRRGGVTLNCVSTLGVLR